MRIVPPVPGYLATRGTPTPHSSVVQQHAATMFGTALEGHVDPMSGASSPRSSVVIDGEPHLNHAGQRFTVTRGPEQHDLTWLPTWMHTWQSTLGNVVEFTRWLWVGGDGMSTIQG